MIEPGLPGDCSPEEAEALLKEVDNTVHKRMMADMKPTRHRTHIGLHVEPELARLVREAARAEGRPVAQLLRRLLVKEYGAGRQAEA